MTTLSHKSLLAGMVEKASAKHMITSQVSVDLLLSERPYNYDIKANLLL